MANESSVRHISHSVVTINHSNILLTATVCNAVYFLFRFQLKKFQKTGKTPSQSPVPAANVTKTPNTHRQQNGPTVVQVKDLNFQK